MKSGWKSGGWDKEGIGEEVMESGLNQNTLRAYTKFSNTKNVLKTCTLVFIAELFIVIQK